MNSNPEYERRLRVALARRTGERPPPAGEALSLSLAEVRELAQEVGCSTQEVERAALAARILPERYRRNLGTIGWAGQMRLLCSTVAIVGAGGLGGWIIEALARMGVGRLIIIDGDIFQENNLNRQLGCTERTLGRPKAECLAERVGEVNSAVEALARVAWLREDNAAELLRGAEVVVDALDTLPARMILSHAARELGVPLVHGAIGGYTGQVTTITPGGAGLEALYGPGPLPERGVEAQLGNPAATPMMIAAWQIHEVIKLLTAQGQALVGRVLVMDAEFGDVTEVEIA